MNKKKQPTLQERIAHEENYVAFLERRLASENYKANATAEEYAETKAKLDKARFILKTLKGPTRK
jgi:hypothetical protein